MAIFRNITLLAFIATSSAAYADSDTDYQVRQMRSEMENNRQAAAIDSQNFQNHLNSMDAPTVYQPEPVYQPLTTDTAYGTVYTGPGSGFTQR